MSAHVVGWCVFSFILLSLSLGFTYFNDVEH